MSITTKISIIIPTTTTTIYKFNSYRTHRQPPPRTLFRTHCSDSNSKRGFGTPKDSKKKKVTISREKNEGVALQQSKEAPGLSSQFVGARTNNVSKDIGFEERLEAVRSAALEQKKTSVNKLAELGPIDYDAPTDSEPKKIGIGTKIGVGVAVIVFGLVFALGDFIPSGSVSPTEEAAMISTNNLSEEEKATLQNRLKQFEATLSDSPKDAAALEGAAVTLAELGEYERAASLLQDLTQEKPSDPEAFRLLGEVKYGLKDYEGSAAAYKNSAKVSKATDFEVLRGLTNALLAADKPSEAVQVILASRERMKTATSTDNIRADSTTSTELQQVDPIQIELLLGKAYSNWGHISDAVSVYDELISNYPDDFRGYLAKGIILKENGNLGDAERMFIQARFLASDKAKALVDRYSRR